MLCIFYKHNLHLNYNISNFNEQEEVFDQFQVIL